MENQLINKIKNYLTPVRMVILTGFIASIIVASFVIAINRDKHVGVFGTNKVNMGPVYQGIFKTGIPVTFLGDRASLGKCEALNAKFIVYDTAATLQFEGRPILNYKVLGLDYKNGLHLLRYDSTEIVVFKVRDSTATGKIETDLLFRQPDGSFLLLPGEKCPY